LPRARRPLPCGGGVAFYRRTLMRGYAEDFAPTISEIRRAAIHGPAIGMRIREERAANREAERQAVIDATRYGRRAYYLAGMALLATFAQLIVSLIR
jgi:hypothetical protein